MPTNNRTHGSVRTSGRSAVQVAALIVGVIFLLAGIAGFIPGITTRIDELPFAGHGSSTMLFGVFAVSVLHNIVHLLSGLAGLLLARTARAARVYLFGGGIVYLALWLYGVFINLGSPANFVPVNTADNWLHLGLGVGMLVLGALTSLGSGGFPRPQAKKGPGLG
ncbi:DUF4383 domain-containing protein [Amycolatopsis keratiniphila]|uniref:DUF4383 domain-containing protein n=1 Tax=Amycolatopsis keratiniphila TaxID=129921 RepID=UPI00087BA678|nr:DUF4383 domain-containing protein [Amycolatopsis keratiniphila]OLZ58095.1 hypothetical protein BS330_12735 [Amycolatopsis keratiniphila subsp. nogabecina]SDU44031.1 protein of unknown function [Amycolatopsis keratiniphila]